jgi:AraC-like DNA-binding protein
VERYEAVKGKLFVVPMNTAHAIYSLEDLINFEIKFTCNDELSERLNYLSFHEVSLDVFEEKIIRDIVSEGIFHLEFSEQVIDFKLGELIVMLLRKNKRGPLIKDQYLVWETNRMIWTGLLHKHMHEIVQMIHAEPEKITSIDILAKKMGYTVPYFCSQFKKAFGVSPQQYIIQLKIEKAKEMMLYTNEDITEIAFKLGFHSIHYFSRCFKKTTGMPPRTYREKSQGDMVVNVIPDSSLIPPTRFEHELLPITDLNGLKQGI